MDNETRIFVAYWASLYRQTMISLGVDLPPQIPGTQDPVSLTALRFYLRAGQDQRRSSISGRPPGRFLAEPRLQRAISLLESTTDTSASASAHSSSQRFMKGTYPPLTPTATPSKPTTTGTSSPPGPRRESPVATPKSPTHKSVQVTDPPVSNPIPTPSHVQGSFGEGVGSKSPRPVSWPSGRSFREDYSGSIRQTREQSPTKTTETPWRPTVESIRSTPEPFVFGEAPTSSRPSPLHPHLKSRISPHTRSFSDPHGETRAARQTDAAHSRVVSDPAVKAGSNKPTTPAQTFDASDVKDEHATLDFPGFVEQDLTATGVDIPSEGQPRQTKAGDPMDVDTGDLGRDANLDPPPADPADPAQTGDPMDLDTGHSGEKGDSGQAAQKSPAPAHTEPDMPLAGIQEPYRQVAHVITPDGVVIALRNATKKHAPEMAAVFTRYPLAQEIQQPMGRIVAKLLHEQGSLAQDMRKEFLGTKQRFENVTKELCQEPPQEDQNADPELIARQFSEKATDKTILKLQSNWLRTYFSLHIGRLTKKYSDAGIAHAHTAASQQFLKQAGELGQSSISSSQETAYNRAYRSLLFFDALATMREMGARLMIIHSQETLRAFLTNEGRPRERTGKASLQKLVDSHNPVLQKLAVDIQCKTRGDFAGQVWSQDLDALDQPVADQYVPLEVRDRWDDTKSRFDSFADAHHFAELNGSPAGLGWELPTNLTTLKYGYRGQASANMSWLVGVVPHGVRGLVSVAVGRIKAASFLGIVPSVITSRPVGSSIPEGHYADGSYGLSADLDRIFGRLSFIQRVTSSERANVLLGWSTYLDQALPQRLSVRLLAFARTDLEFGEKLRVKANPEFAGQTPSLSRLAENCQDERMSNAPAPERTAIQCRDLLTITTNAHADGFDMTNFKKYWDVALHLRPKESLWMELGDLESLSDLGVDLSTDHTGDQDHSFLAKWNDDYQHFADRYESFALTSVQHALLAESMTLKGVLSAQQLSGTPEPYILTPIPDPEPEAKESKVGAEREKASADIEYPIILLSADPDFRLRSILYGLACVPHLNPFFTQDYRLYLRKVALNATSSGVWHANIDGIQRSPHLLQALLRGLKEDGVTRTEGQTATTELHHVLLQLDPSATTGPDTPLSSLVSLLIMVLSETLITTDELEDPLPPLPGTPDEESGWVRFVASKRYSIVVEHFWYQRNRETRCEGCGSSTQHFDQNVVFELGFGPGEGGNVTLEEAVRRTMVEHPITLAECSTCHQRDVSGATSRSSFQRLPNCLWMRVCRESDFEDSRAPGVVPISVLDDLCLDDYMSTSGNTKRPWQAAPLTYEVQAIVLWHATHEPNVSTYSVVTRTSTETLIEFSSHSRRVVDREYLAGSKIVLLLWSWIGAKVT